MTALTTLRAADERWLATLSALSDADLRAPSLLPGWTRAHVAAHVALNGEAFRRVLTQALAGEAPSMYDSSEARDADIEALATASGAELAERNRRAADDVARLLGQVEEPRWTITVSRLPGGGGMVFPLSGVLPRRLGEVLIHHADLGAGFTHRDWPPEFARDLVVTRAPRHEHWAFEAADTGESWGSPSTASLVVRGAAADLGWWLTGRGAGEGLSSSPGELPPPPGF